MFLKKLNPFIAFGITLVIIVLLITLFFKNPFGIPGISIDTSRTSVVKEIQELNRLETASFTIEKIIEGGQQGNIFQNLLFGDRILLIAHGKVIAGVDMSNITEEDVNFSGQTLEINLPAPEIFSSTLDNEKTSVYDRQQGLLGGNDDLESEARRAAESSIRDAACEAGILDEARENATRDVTQLFEFAGFSDVKVTIPEGSC